MQREIKFRAWEKNDKEMFYPKDFENSDGLVAIGFHGLPVAVDRDSFTEEGIKGWNIDHRLILMQYTGLKDKNGREIYEGDIIETPIPNERMQVRFNLYRAGFEGVLEGIWNGHSYKHFMYGASLVECEVIGNIYENANLLEAA